MQGMTDMTKTFRETLQAKLKQYMREYLIKLRRDMELSKEQMAERLYIDARSYSYIESGTYLCGFMTFCAILQICPDKEKLIKDLEAILTEVWNEAA